MMEFSPVEVQSFPSIERIATLSSFTQTSKSGGIFGKKGSSCQESKRMAGLKKKRNDWLSENEFGVNADKLQNCHYREFKYFRKTKILTAFQKGHFIFHDI